MEWARISSALEPDLPGLSPISCLCPPRRIWLRTPNHVASRIICRRTLSDVVVLVLRKISRQSLPFFRTSRAGRDVRNKLREPEKAILGQSLPPHNHPPHNLPAPAIFPATTVTPSWLAPAFMSPVYLQPSMSYELDWQRVVKVRFLTL